MASLFLGLLPAHIWAAPPTDTTLVLNDRFTTAPVSSNAQVFKLQKDQKTSISELVNKLPAAFALNADAHNIFIGPAYQYPTAWIKIALHNHSDYNMPLVVEVEHNRCDTLEAFLVSGNEPPVYLGKLYRGLALAQRPIPLKIYALPFTLPKAAQAQLWLYSRRTTGVHEMNISLSTPKHFTIKNSEQELEKIFALSSSCFFMFAVFSLGIIFRHPLLVRFGIYAFALVVGQLNQNFFFDQLVFPSMLKLNADNIGLFIIFLGNAFMHIFGVCYIKSLGLYKKWHRIAIWLLVALNMGCMLLLALFPLGSNINFLVTNGSLVLTTINILWLFYIAVLGFINKRDKYLLITSVLILLPILYKTYAAETPALNFNYLQPFYFLLMFSYLIVSLFKKELTSRQLSAQKIREVQVELEEVRKTEIAHIGRNLHDQLGNTLASALGYLNMQLPKVTVAKKLILNAIGEIRLISHNLVKNDNRLLNEKLEDIAERFNDFSPINFVFHDFSENRLNLLSKLKQESIYMIVQEVLNNIIKHSQAKEATIQAFFADEMLRISIEDDGIGYNLRAATAGIGQSNMQKRAKLANLKLAIDSGTGGTTVTIETALENIK